MNTRSISHFQVPELTDLPADILQRIESVQEKAGFISNIFLALAHRADEIRTFIAYHDTLMDKETVGSNMRTNEEFSLMGRLPK